MICTLSTFLVLVFFLCSCLPGQAIISTRPDTPISARPPRPYPYYVWVDGDWIWTGARYMYKPGYWTAPQPHSVYTAGSWERRGNGWHWKKGRWHR